MKSRQIILFVWISFLFVSLTFSFFWAFWLSFADKFDFVYHDDGSVRLFENYVFTLALPPSLYLIYRLQPILQAWKRIFFVTFFCLLLSMIFLDFSVALGQRIFNSQKRARILEKVVGPYFDLCKILQIGMSKVEVISEKGSPATGFYKIERDGKLFEVGSFFGAEGAALRQVWFDQGGAVVKIECFDGSVKE